MGDIYIDDSFPDSETAKQPTNIRNIGSQKSVNRIHLYNNYPINPETGFLSEKNFNNLKTPVFNTIRETILFNVVERTDEKENESARYNVGLNEVEACILSIRNGIDFSKSKVLFIACNEGRFIKKQSNFISNLEHQIKNFQKNDCIHICIGSTESNPNKPEEKYGHMAALCFYKKEDKNIDYFVYDPKGKSGQPSNEKALTGGLCQIIKEVMMPNSNIDLNDKSLIDSLINKKYFSEGSQSNIGNCAINTVNFVKNFEDQRNTGINVEHICVSLKRKAVILLKTAIATEHDTNSAISLLPEEKKYEINIEIVEGDVEENERNNYIKVEINGVSNNNTYKFNIPKDRSVFLVTRPEGISCNKLLISIGVENLAINKLVCEKDKPCRIEIDSNNVISYFVDNVAIDIEKLRQTKENQEKEQKKRMGDVQQKFPSITIRTNSINKQSSEKLTNPTAELNQQHERSSDLINHSNTASLTIEEANKPAAQLGPNPRSDLASHTLNLNKQTTGAYSTEQNQASKTSKKFELKPKPNQRTLGNRPDFNNNPVSAEDTIKTISLRENRPDYSVFGRDAPSSIPPIDQSRQTVLQPMSDIEKSQEIAQEAAGKVTTKQPKLPHLNTTKQPTGINRTKLNSVLNANRQSLTRAKNPPKPKPVPGTRNTEGRVR